MSNDKVQLVIEIDKKVYEHIRDKKFFISPWIDDAIANGTLITDGDVDKAVKILRNYHNGYFGYKIDDVQKAHDLAIAALVTSSTRQKGGAE